jgi:hypothetical protein
MTTKATLERVAIEDTLEKQQSLPFSIRDSFKIFSWSYTYINTTRFFAATLVPMSTNQLQSV